MKIPFSGLLFATAIAGTFLLPGCYYDVEEELYPLDPSSCDTSGVTYSQTIAPIMNSSCNGCHSSSSPSGGIILDTYNAVKQNVDNGKLMGSVRWESGYSAMPQGGNKLDDCTIRKMETWVNAGAPNN